MHGLYTQTLQASPSLNIWEREREIILCQGGMYTYVTSKH